MASPVPTPLAAGILALVAAASLVSLAYGLGELRLAYHVLRSEPESTLDATDGGPIELRGTARSAGRTVRSPFTDARCLVCEYEVREEHNTQNGKSWRTIDSGTEYAPFLLEDGSGSVLIEPPGADVRLEASDRIDVKGGTEPPERIRRYIDETEDVDDQNTAVDLRVFELTTGRDRRFVERRLEAGEEAHVLGTARYDTTVSRTAGQVNAAVGIDERALSSSLPARVRHRLFGYPFVISDRSERGLGLRAGAAGVAAVGVPTAILLLAAAWVV